MLSILCTRPTVAWDSGMPPFASVSFALIINEWLIPLGLTMVCIALAGRQHTQHPSELPLSLLIGVIHDHPL
jgi:hypothetical protein